LHEDLDARDRIPIPVGGDRVVADLIELRRKTQSSQRAKGDRVVRPIRNRGSSLMPGPFGVKAEMGAQNTLKQVTGHRNIHKKRWEGLSTDKKGYWLQRGRGQRKRTALWIVRKD